MIVEKPIGAVKIRGIISRLTVGKRVPKDVIDYWTETGQIEDLEKAGIISDGSAGKESKKDKKDMKTDESVFEDQK